MGIRSLAIFLSIFFVFIVGKGILYGQDHVFLQFSEEEGIPSNDVYDILRSSNDHLWFATVNGVSRFDGDHFENYNIEDGLPSASVIKLYEDFFGNVWFLSYNGMLSYFKDGIITPYQYNDSIYKYFSDNYFGKICLDSVGNLLLSPREGGKAVIDNKGNVHTRRELVPFSRDSCYLFFNDRGEDHFITIQSSKPDDCFEDEGFYYCDDSYYIKVEYSSKQYQRNYAKTAPNEFVVSYRNFVYLIRDQEIVNKKTFEEEVLSLFLDHRGNIWISIKFDNGLYMFEDKSLEGEPVHFLDGYTVTKVAQDREDGYWLSTEGHGIFFSPGFDFSLNKLPGSDQNVNIIAFNITGDRMYFTARDKEVYFGSLSEGKISNIRKLKIEKPLDRIKYILVDRHGYLWLSSTPSLRYDPAGFPFPPDTVINTGFLAKCKGDTIIAATKRLAIYRNGKLEKLFLPEIEKRVFAAYQNDQGLWIGTLYGLFLSKEDTFVSYESISPILTDRINCINQLGNMLIVGTAANGIVLLNGDSIVHSISQTEGLWDNNITSVFTQNDTTLWVGTKQGLNRIFFDDSAYRIEGYGNSDGLPGNEINAISQHDGYMWLATENGLVSFNPNDLEPHIVPPQIHIHSIQINGRDTLILDEYILDHNQNDIRIIYSGLSFRQEEDPQYRYQLSNYNNEIINTKNNFASFPNLPPGEYIFHLNVGSIHGIWNDEPIRIPFTINKHYSQTSGFIVLLIVVSSLLVLGITLFIQRQQKIKEEARNEMARMEQKMFRLQMNPHFVFNALLAIQGFMYQRNTHDAGRYLTSFAKLIRHTLYGSSEELIPLDREVEAMQYYLDLQRLRFNENFEFIIEIGEDVIPESVNIPPLLIQPFLENAIEHGLQHKRDNGKLSLKIDHVDHALRVEIEDNGIGREEAMRIQKKRSKLHKSLGMGIVQSRIESLQKITGKNIKLEIIDLTDELGKGKGTLIRIMIPD